MSKKIKLFTHTDLDGIGCAILAYLAFGKENVDVEYCNYDDVNEKVREFYLHNEIVYDAIYITDISINEENAQELDTWVARDKLRLFDHHGTDLWLNKYKWCVVDVFSDGRGGQLKTCGAELFFKYLINEGCFDHCNNVSKLLSTEMFVKTVRDYDTWMWKEDNYWGIHSKNLNDLLGIYGRDLFIDRCLEMISLTIFPNLDDIEMCLLENLHRTIDNYINKKNGELIVFNDRFGKLCGVVFAERYFSELGNRLSELHPELDYIAMIDVAGRKVSYRTVKDDIDLGKEIAHAYGGGGHAKAAGSTFGEEVWFDIFARLFTTTAL